MKKIVKLLELRDHMATAVLYSGTRNASSWAMRAWLSLRAAKFEFEERVVDIRRPQRYANLDRIAAFSPPASVPVLVVDGHVIFDSLAIMEFANDMSGGQLLPNDMLLRAQARALVAWQHAGLSSICPKISFESAFYPWKRRLTEDEHKEAARLFSAIEPILSANGGPYLFGGPTLADFALAPAAIRLSRHFVDFNGWRKSEAWAEAVTSHPLVRDWLSEADAMPPVWYDDYLVLGEPHGLFAVN